MKREMAEIRIIPALAGSTSYPDACSDDRRDHPRACGEHDDVCLKGGREGGPSPRLRGARDGVSRLRGSRGIIPALAGSTAACSCAILSRRDHPRACGEHSYRCVVCRRSGGSSPRLRGAPEQVVDVVNRPGIIPALAGSTRNFEPFALVNRDHPRACGEHDAEPCQRALFRGSSPRLRGARPGRGA